MIFSTFKSFWALPWVSTLGYFQEDIEDIKKKTEALVQASMKLGEAIYKSQQSTKPDSGKDDGKDEKGKKDDNVVDADFEEVKDENKEKSA